MPKSKLQLKNQNFLIVGLGNPGEKYQNNRHNIGYLIADQITKSQPVSPSAYRGGNQNAKFKTLKPNVFMNNSGEAVKKTAGYYKVKRQNIIVIHDDLDLELGTVRISYGASSGGHQGVQSIIDQLKTADFWRARVGIGRPPEKVPPEKFVLQDFSAQEKDGLSQIIDQTAKTVLELISNPKEKIIKTF